MCIIYCRIADAIAFIQNFISPGGTSRKREKKSTSGTSSFIGASFWRRIIFEESLTLGGVAIFSASRDRSVKGKAHRTAARGINTSLGSPAYLHSVSITPFVFIPSSSRANRIFRLENEHFILVEPADFSDRPAELIASISLALARVRAHFPTDISGITPLLLGTHQTFRARIRFTQVSGPRHERMSADNFH